MCHEFISIAAIICRWQGDVSNGFRMVWKNEVCIFLAQILKTWSAEDDPSVKAQQNVYQNFSTRGRLVQPDAGDPASASHGHGLAARCTRRPTRHAQLPTVLLLSQLLELRGHLRHLGP